MQQPGSTALSDLENLYYAQTAGLGLPAQRTTIISCPKKMVGRYALFLTAKLNLAAAETQGNRRIDYGQARK